MRRSAVLTLALIGTTTAFAQTPPQSEPAAPSAAHEFDGTRTMDGITIDELESIVKAGGYTYKRLSGSYGDYLEVQSADGYKYEASLNDCPESGERRCWSLTLLSYSFNETPRVTLKGVNEWNGNAWGVRGMLYKDGTSGVAMNLGVNGGVTEAWIAKRFGNFDYWLTAFGDFVAGNTPAAAPTPTP